MQFIEISLFGFVCCCCLSGGRFSGRFLSFFFLIFWFVGNLFPSHRVEFVSRPAGSFLAFFGAIVFICLSFSHLFSRPPRPFLFFFFSFLLFFCSFSFSVARIPMAVKKKPQKNSVNTKKNNPVPRRRRRFSFSFSLVFCFHYLV